MFDIIVGSIISFIVYIFGLCALKIAEEKIFRPDRYKGWKAWAKRNTNNFIYKLLVLFGWCRSPSLDHYFELEAYRERWVKEGYIVAETYKDVKKEKSDE